MPVLKNQLGFKPSAEVSQELRSDYGLVPIADPNVVGYCVGPEGDEASVYVAIKKDATAVDVADLLCWFAMNWRCDEMTREVRDADDIVIRLWWD